MTDLYYVPYSEISRLRSLPLPAEAQAALFATACRVNTLYAIKRAGSGHLGTSFSCMDIVSWLFLNELRLPGKNGDDAPVDTYFSSKGHDVPALYSVLIGLGLLKFDLLHRLRRIGGLPGHPDVSTPFIPTNTGSLGMGISKAKGMVLADRLQDRQGRVYVLTGDGELQEGQFWESLQSAANLGLGEITAIVDHNKMQSDTWVSEVSDLGSLEGKFEAFGWRASRCDGHDYEALAAELERLRPITDRPKVIIADTIKGKGVSFVEHTAMDADDRLYRFHSGAPDDASYEKAVAELTRNANRQLRDVGAHELKLETVTVPAEEAESGSQRLVTAYANALVREAAGNKRIVALDADLALDCGLIPFQEAFPDRFFECGIAEQDMVSQAGAMALQGLLPVVHSFGCFLSARPNEQIYNNATEGTKIIYVGALAGLLPGGPGHSHQCVRDISALASVPNLILVEPSCQAELDEIFHFCVNRTRESCYLRVVSVPFRASFALPDDYHVELGKGVAITPGADAVLFAYGPVLLNEAVMAARLLADRGVGIKVVNLPWLNRVDSKWLNEELAGFDWMFTLDNHYVTGGQGQMLLSQLVQLNRGKIVRARQFGVRTIPAFGSDQEVLEAHRLDAASLAVDIEHAMGAAAQ